MTPAGITVADGYDRLIGVSVNSARLQIYITSSDPVDQGPESIPVIDPVLTFPDQEVGTHPVLRAFSFGTTARRRSASQASPSMVISSSPITAVSLSIRHSRARSISFSLRRLSDSVPGNSGWIPAPMLSRCG